MNADSKRQKIIASWSERARAYHSLTHRWPLFSHMAKRLIESLPLPRDDADVLDLGSGVGLLSETLLQRSPRLKVQLCDPSPEMLKLSEDVLGERARGYHLKAAHELGALGLRFDGILCSAAFHLMDEKLVLPAISQALKPGGHFVCNLWGHSFNETAALDQGQDWRPVVTRALENLGFESLPWPLPSAPRRRTRDGLAEAARQAGLCLELCEIDEDQVSGAFTIDFLAMRERWPRELPPGGREEVLARARELMKAKEACYTVRLGFRKA